MPNKPSISVVIPTHNRCHTLARALDSVVEQSVQPDEIIVIDDGSTDATGELLKTQYPNVKTYRQSNHGVSHARNRGIESSNSEWIALLDSDDAWYPGKLEAQLRELERDPDVRLCHSDEHWIRNGKRVNQRERHAKRGGRIFQHCLPLCAISPSASMIHRNVFTDIGFFDEALPACEDYDFWLRLTARESVAYCDAPLVIKHGGHQDQLSRKFMAMDRFRLVALDKILSSGVLGKSDEQAAIRTLGDKFQVYSAGAMKRGRTAEIAELRSRYSNWLSRYTTEHVDSRF